MENQNGTSKPLINQHSHSRQSSQEDFVSDFEGHFSKSSGYDPKRIPSSVFSARPATPMEWSVASNESLFSIHPGNSSFSKELYKSGELAKVEDQPGKPPKPDEPSKVSKPEECKKSQPSLPPVPKLAYNMERILEIDEVNNNKQKISHGDTRSERSSSTTSIKSFQFPVLENDTGRHTSMKRENLQEEKEKHSQQPPPQLQSSELPCHSDQSQEQLRPQPVSQSSRKAPEFGHNDASSWFSCIPCLSPCTSNNRQPNN